MTKGTVIPGTTTILCQPPKRMTEAYEDNDKPQLHKPCHHLQGAITNHVTYHGGANNKHDHHHPQW